MQAILRANVPFTLKWTQPRALRSEYELHAGSELVGLLKFRSSFGTLATGQMADGTWTFKRVGFWRQALTIRAAGSDTDLTTFHNNTWSAGGWLELPDGRRVLATNNTWQTRYEWSLETGKVLFRFKMGGVFRQRADVEVLAAGAAMPELSMLLLVSWYLAVMLARESAAAGA